MQNLISINELSKEEILQILTLADKFKKGLVSSSLSNKIIASCFFEASTRTRLSFESAILRLGGKVIGFADASNTSLNMKGESITDTFKIISGYADAIVLRHPMDGAARLACDCTDIPIINAGDGANQHPTQTLLDLYSILATQGSLEGKAIGLMGDLKYSRTITSLVEAAKLFNMRLYFISPKELKVDEDLVYSLKRSSIEYSFHTSVTSVIHHLDCLYLTRLQKERLGSDIINAKYGITLDDLANARDNFKIMHPLPRLDELPVEIDNTPYAYYFEQAQNGLYVRQAVLELILGDK